MIHNRSLDIQQTSGEGMMVYKSVDISSNRVLEEMKDILQKVSNMERGRRNV